MTERVSDEPVIPETPKRATEMSPFERAQALAAIKRGTPPEPLPMDKTVWEMSPAERRRWLAEHVRRTELNND